MYMYLHMYVSIYIYLHIYSCEISHKQPAASHPVGHRLVPRSCGGVGRGCFEGYYSYVCIYMYIVLYYITIYIYICVCVRVHIYIYIIGMSSFWMLHHPNLLPSHLCTSTWAAEETLLPGRREPKRHRGARRVHRLRHARTAGPGDSLRFNGWFRDSNQQS